MRLACRLTNGDGIGFDYATIDLTSDYAAWLLALAAKAAEIKQTHGRFYAIELFDSAVEYGSALGALEHDTAELIDSANEWAQVPDNHRWPDGCLQSVSAATVVVTADSIHWCAASKHGDDGTYFETQALTVARLQEMFPSQVAETSTESRRYILYDHDTEDLATTTVYTSYDDAVDDASRLDNVMVLALAFEQEVAPVRECEQSTTAGECVLSFSVYYDPDVTDPEALGYAFDRLLETAMSTPGILDEYGNPTIGTTFLGSDSGVSPVCECEQPGYFCSGVPGILARVENGRLVDGAKVERCDSCGRYPSDKAAFEKLVELGIASREPAQESTQDSTLPHAKEYVDAGGGFCPNCRSDQIEGDSVDFDGRYCSQRMSCLECDAVWFDVYTLSSVEPRED